jgi:predicted nucleic acid-binding protein
MSGLLDTSMVVRYLIGDSPHLAEQAARVIDNEENLQITDVVIAETAYVLMSVYRIPRNVVVEHLTDFLRKENISPFGLDKGLVIQGLLLCKPSGRVSFADAMVWAAGSSTESRVVHSLDVRFPDYNLEIRRG